MKKALLLSLVILLFTGCFDIEQQLIINADGSGEIITITTASKAFLAMSAMGGSTDTTKNSLAKTFDAHAQNSEETVRYIGTSTEHFNDMVRTTTTLSFDDITDVKLPILGIPDSSFSRSDTSGYISFTKRRSKIVMDIKTSLSSDDSTKHSSVTSLENSTSSLLTDSTDTLETTPEECADMTLEQCEAFSNIRKTLEDAPERILAMMAKDTHFSFVVTPRGEFSTDAAYANDTTITIINLDFVKLFNSTDIMAIFRDSTENEIDSLQKENKGNRIEFLENLFVLNVRQDALDSSQAELTSRYEQLNSDSIRAVIDSSHAVLDSIQDEIRSSHAMLDSTHDRSDFTRREINARQEDLNITRREINASQEEHYITFEKRNVTQRESNDMQDEINATYEDLLVTRDDFYARKEDLDARKEAYLASKKGTDATQDQVAFSQFNTFLLLGEAAGVTVEPKEQVIIRLN